MNNTALVTSASGGIGHSELVNGRRVVVARLRNKLLAQSARVAHRRLVTRVGRTLWQPT